MAALAFALGSVLAVFAGIWRTSSRHPHGATTVGEGAIRSTSLLLGPGDPAATLLERPEFTQVGRAVVVDPAGRPLGVISVTDMARALARSALSG